MTFSRGRKVKTIPITRQFVSFAIVAVLVLQHLLIISPITAEAAIGSPISITALDTLFAQNFNSLAGGTPVSFTPDGWDFIESGTNANTTYSVGTGSGTSGDTYSFDTAGEFSFANSSPSLLSQITAVASLLSGLRAANY